MMCSIETYDIETGQSEVVVETNLHAEAPNWTPDGKALIVNVGGRVYQLNFDEPRLIAIDTGRCVGLNNDHVLSPDGETLGICDKGAYGKSCIYLLPASGGAPRQVTKNLPSWLHGWAPSGQRIVYTAVRDGDFCIAGCNLDGSDEQILITSLHHYDGPDYTPDGEWIWFNSDRSGQMSLWRMRADGSDAEQMTFGESVDWFPHPSPNGKDLCFLAYPAGTQGHPFGMDVDLCLIPIQGGPVRKLFTVHGGQGTLNVPSWSPDGRRFAYIRYPKIPSE